MIRLLLLMLIATPALAYLPPSQFIVKNIVNKRNDVKAVRVKSIVSGLEGDKPTSNRFTAVTLYHAQSATLKSWALGDNGVRLFGIQRRGLAIPPVSALLFEPRLADVVRSLREVGIPVRSDDELRGMRDEEERRAAEVSYIARWKNGVAWVIGRKVPMDSHELQPQLWVEKDTFLPMRMRYRTGSDDGVDIQFENVRTFRGFPYPKTITVHDKEGASWLRDDVLEIAVNPKADEIEEAVEGGFTEAGGSISSSLKELIQRYYGVIR